MDRADGAVRALAALLAADPPLARRLVAVARAQGAGPGLLDAIVRLGAPRARLLVDGLCWRERLIVDGGGPAGADPAARASLRTALWRHSLACAHAAMALAQFTGRLPPDDAWRMGLLHDLGEREIVEHGLADLASTEPASAAQWASATRLRGRLATRTLRRWVLPAPLVVAIARHARAGRCGPNGALALLQVAHGIADTLGRGFGPPLSDRVDLPAAREVLGLTPAGEDRIRMAVQPRLEAMLAELASARG